MKMYVTSLEGFGVKLYKLKLLRKLSLKTIPLFKTYIKFWVERGSTKTRLLSTGDLILNFSMPPRVFDFKLIRRR